MTLWRLYEFGQENRRTEDWARNPEHLPDVWNVTCGQPNTNRVRVPSFHHLSDCFYMVDLFLVQRSKGLTKSAVSLALSSFPKQTEELHVWEGSAFQCFFFFVSTSHKGRQTSEALWWIEWIGSILDQEKCKPPFLEHEHSWGLPALGLKRYV